MNVIFYQSIHCGSENYIVRKKIEWNRPLPRAGEYVTGIDFLHDVNDEHLVKKVIHDLSEDSCSIELADYTILENTYLCEKFKNSVKVSDWECEKI